MFYLIIGILAGILAGMFGLGGGIIIVPALIEFGRMKPHMATGTSLTALLLPVGALGVWEYYKKGMVSVPSALWIAGGLVIGAWLGARVSISLSSQVLQKVFAAFLVIVAVHLWYTVDHPRKTNDVPNISAEHK